MIQIIHEIENPFDVETPLGYGLALFMVAGSIQKTTGIRRTSTKEATKRSEVVSEQSVQEQTKIDVMAILAEKYPMNGEDYAIQLFYKTNRNAFMKVTAKCMDEDQETAHLEINGNRYKVNIRTAKISKI